MKSRAASNISKFILFDMFNIYCVYFRACNAFAVVGKMAIEDINSG